MACNTESPDQSAPQTVKKAPVLPVDSVQPQVIALQNESNILGDKILLSNQADGNGLRSPDSILIIGTFLDSLKAVQVQKELRIPTRLISTSRYHYPGKETPFLLFSQNLSDSVTHSEAIPQRIFKIRPNNFSDDKSLLPTELALAYSHYEVRLLHKSRNVYLIHPKKTYEHARMFTRLIQFDNEGRQVNTQTIPDFAIIDIIYTETGYWVALNDFGHGAARLFREGPYAWKTAWLDHDLRLIGDFELSQTGTHINGVRYEDQQYIASLEIHTGCDMCDEAYCYVEVAFNTGFDPVEVKITQQPRDYNLDADTLLKVIRSQ